MSSLSFFSRPAAPTAIYTLSLHDALPIQLPPALTLALGHRAGRRRRPPHRAGGRSRRSQGGTQTNGRADRKSTRLNSSHQIISYAVFCLKKKNDIDEPCTRLECICSHHTL